MFFLKIFNQFTKKKLLSVGLDQNNIATSSILL